MTLTLEVTDHLYGLLNAEAKANGAPVGDVVIERLAKTYTADAAEADLDAELSEALSADPKNDLSLETFVMRLDQWVSERYPARTDGSLPK